MKRVLIMGGTGFIGSQAVKALVAQGDTVYGLARSDESARRLTAIGATPVRGDVYEPDAWIDTLPELDYAINVLGFFTDGMPSRFTTAFAERCRKKYILWAEVLLRLAREKALKAVVHVTGTAIYADRGVDWVTEDSPLADRPWGFSRIATDGNTIMKRAMEEKLPVIVAVAPSVVYGDEPGTSFDMVFVRPLQRGQMGVVGHGRNYITTGHVEDVGRAIAFLTDERFKGEYFHIADDQPVTQSEFLHAIARGLGKEKVVKLPPWLVSILGGRCAAEFMSLSQRIDNTKLKSAGFTLNYPKFLDEIPGVMSRLEGRS